MSEKKRVPYIDKIHQQREEVGNINPQDLIQIVRDAPPSEEPALYRLSFHATEGFIPETSAKIQTVGELFRVSEIKNRYSDERSDFEDIIRGGKIETIKADFPTYHEGIEGMIEAAKTFQKFKEYALLLVNNGYEIQPESFMFGNYAARTHNRHPGFFCETVAGRIGLTTEEMVKGEHQRKLVLVYTPELVTTREFQKYKGLLDKIRQSKKD